MKFNKKLLNLSAWITLLITYTFPYQSQSTDSISTYFGYPFVFLTVYKRPINTSLLYSNHINLIPLALNILVVYFAIHFANVLWFKMKFKRAMNKSKASK